jgi:hypothetical protein
MLVTGLFGLPEIPDNDTISQVSIMALPIFQRLLRGAQASRHWGQENSKDSRV